MCRVCPSPQPQPLSWEFLWGLIHWKEPHPQVLELTRCGFGHLTLFTVLGFQHPFVSKVTSNRALRELVAEAKAEVMEEIEESRDEAEEDDSSESASVSSFTSVAVLGERAWQLFQAPKAVLDYIRWRGGGCLAREGLGFGGCQGHGETMVLAGGPVPGSQEGLVKSG